MNRRQYLTPGFSLIEVLVALLVLGIGLLGMASLQIIGIRSTYESTLRSLAVNQCYEMADRIRANIAGVQAAGYNTIGGGETDPGCGTNCTALQSATYDAYQWNLRNTALLPSGAGTVGLTTAGPSSSPNCGTFTITVNWVERQQGVPVTRSFISRVQPCSI